MVACCQLMILSGPCLPLARYQPWCSHKNKSMSEKDQKEKWTSPPRIGGRGFSLIELLVVLVLFSLAAAVVLPSFTTGMEGLRLNTAARNMVTKLKQARSRAIAGQKVFRVVFFLPENESEKEAAYAIRDDYGGEVEKMALPPGFNLILDPELEPMVSFYPNGSSSGFQLLVENGREHRLMVEIDPISGLARARRLTDEGGS